jgi:hypothetical protein
MAQEGDGEEEVKITLRLPSGLHGDLQKLADEEVRSLNGQLVYLLQEAVKHRDVLRYAYEFRDFLRARSKRGTQD